MTYIHTYILYCIENIFEAAERIERIQLELPALFGVSLIYAGFKLKHDVEACGRIEKAHLGLHMLFPQPFGCVFFHSSTPLPAR